jgi:UDPglucose 6-dehydrogenase
MSRVGIIGLGFVGSAIYKSFSEKQMNVVAYDKYKNGGIGDILQCLDTDILFLCLPTVFDSKTNHYDKVPIYETAQFLKDKNYQGAIVIKSTIEPLTTKYLCETYGLNFVHNPEFLKARSAYEDFHNQTHIVLGRGETCDDTSFNNVVQMYSTYYPLAKISQCISTESECMKIYCNCFYSVKIQFFTELYLLSEKLGLDQNKITQMMINNGSINPAFTQIPGPDGSISYGGLCFPKDTNALLNFMKQMETPNEVLEATVKERETMRDDHLNIK